MIKKYFDLNRFIKAQEKTYLNALEEIRRGKKETHWMWYIFPQLADLGYSKTAKYYGISGYDEAKEYLNNSILRNNLIEISQALYNIDGDITYIFGYPDYLKLKSCMTLFNYVDPTIDIFKKILDKFYNNEKDEITLNILKNK